MREINDEDLFTSKKLVIFGSKGVGKSSFVQALKGRAFSFNIQHSSEGKIRNNKSSSFNRLFK